MLRHPLLPAAAIAAACTCAARAQTVIPGFTVEILATGLAAPTCAAVAPDGRIFIAQQGGRVRIYRDDLGLLPDRFHAFRTVVPVGYDERGLIGIELHPDFQSNGYLYAHVSRDTQPLGASIMRVTASPANANVADPATETEIFNIGTYSQLVNHVGGALHFGPDGAIYIGVGSNPGRHTPQSLDSTFGKILRINPDGSIPADNPFYDSTSGNNRAIWALGLRNPFTFAFHPLTGRMFINDVGHADWEEINEGIAGANFGWPPTEGDFDPDEFPGFSRPFSTYHHRDGAVTGLAITGGAFYEPPLCSFPAAYVGSYFFSDFNGNWVKRLEPSTGTVHDFAADLGLVVDT